MKIRHWVLLGLFLLYIILIQDSIVEFISWSLRLNVSKNLDDLSSGRLTLYKIAFENIKNNFWTGIPTYYIDNLFICLLVEYGFIGFIIVITFLGNVFTDCIKFFRAKNYQIFFLLVIPLLVSLFEALPPFGPGAIYCTVWFYYGISMQRNKC